MGGLRQKICFKYLVASNHSMERLELWKHKSVCMADNINPSREQYICDSKGWQSRTGNIIFNPPLRHRGRSSHHFPAISAPVIVLWVTPVVLCICGLQWKYFSPRSLFTDISINKLVQPGLGDTDLHKSLSLYLPLQWPFCDLFMFLFVMFKGE